MLKDELSVLSKGGRRTCKVGAILDSLDEETAEALVVAMRSDASTMAITRALAADGKPVGRDVVAVKRECFKNPTEQCCIYEKIKSLIGGKK